jgi:hypothetical protein
MGQAIRGFLPHPESQIAIAIPSEQNLFYPREKMASLIFQRHPAKNIGTNGIGKIHPRLAAT